MAGMVMKSANTVFGRAIIRFTMGFLFMSKVIPRKANTHPDERSFQSVLTVAAEVGSFISLQLSILHPSCPVFAEEGGG